MAKITLKFDERVLKEHSLEEEATIGRLPDNTVVIDNPAVSGRHARIVREGDGYVIEDLRSKNGTYVNQRHVTRQPLQNRDVVVVGKHKLLFDASADTVPGAAGQASLPTPGATTYLDTREHRERLARLREARAARAEATRTDVAPTLRMHAGASPGTEYALQTNTSIIGTSEIAVVRLRGWFKPRAAAAIMREDSGFAVIPMKSRVVVNGDRVHGRRELKDGDVIEVAGVVLEFRWAQTAGATSPASGAAIASAAM